MALRKPKVNPIVWALKEKGNVMFAVMLRDMRTRFFDHGLGFLVVSIWPLIHMAGLLLVYSFSGRQAPYGESLNIFFATGLIPTLLFMYVSRFMSLSLLMNRPLMSFPVVHVSDILIARAILECIAAAITLAMIFSILIIFGDDPRPIDLTQAVLCYLSTILLAVGIGTLAGVIVMFSPFFATIYALLMLFVYVSSGTLFVASALPESIGNALAWSPIVQSVEWMRTAYFETYPDRLVDKPYLVTVGLVSLGLGLFLERMLRRQMLES